MFVENPLFSEQRKQTAHGLLQLQKRFTIDFAKRGDRVVFNIKGNNYRLVTTIDYRRQIVFIKWLGPHRDYDRIDAMTVRYGD